MDLTAITLLILLYDCLENNYFVFSNLATFSQPVTNIKYTRSGYFGV